jgi:uncharacterized small protein (DUF1192 family)
MEGFEQPRSRGKARDTSEGTRPEDRSGDSLQRRPFRIVIGALLVAGAVAVAGLGIGACSQAEQTGNLERQVDSLAAQVDALSRELVNQRASGSALADVVLDVGDLDDRVAATEDEIASTEADLGRLATCVNDYMDTVADAGGGYYTYRRCFVLSR